MKTKLAMITRFKFFKNIQYNTFMKLLLRSLFTLLLPLSVSLAVFSTMSYASQSEPEKGLWKIDGVLSALIDSNDKVKILALEKILKEDDLFRTHFKKIESGITKLLKSCDADVRGGAVYALKAMGASAKEYLPQIAAMLKDTSAYEREAAVREPGAMGESAKEYAPQIAALLYQARSDAINVLDKTSPVVIDTILVIVNQIYEDNSRLNSNIFFAYYFCGGEPDLTIFIKWIGSPEYSQPQILKLSIGK